MTTPDLLRQQPTEQPAAARLGFTAAPEPEPAPAPPPPPAADPAPPVDLQAALAASIDRAGKPTGQVPSTRRSRSAKAGK